MSINILVAEDDKDINDLLSLYLAKENYNVYKAYNGLEAVDFITNEEINLALLDIMMPGLNGYEVLKVIRKKSDIPVLFLTAKDQDEDKILGLDLGADDYISKPFNILEVISRINANLRRYLKTNEKKTLKNGELIIDIDDYSVTKNKKNLELNPKEFGILRLLMESPGRVFTMEQIYRDVWKEEYYGDKNTIMVHISHLREKIEDNPKKPEYIVTIKGIGYKMVRKNEE
jgi:DNA-binding response OmpR family regulator